MSPRAIPDAVRRKQADASDPRCSAFVAANAGSGKTHVLAQRVIRLMLDGGLGGVDPSRILCITFTKAAAANMAARVYDRLRGWIALDDDALDAAMREIGVTAIDAGKRARARALFAAALETPGGLKVQTIHAFCTRLLQQFPFEANVAARFTVLDDRSQAEMFERATMAVLLRAAGAPASPLGRALVERARRRGRGHDLPCRGARSDQATRSAYASHSIMNGDQLGKPETLLADSGYFSAANVTACEAANIAPLIAMGRQPHHQSLQERLRTRRRRRTTRRRWRPWPTAC
jgi:UvrD/REP helicase N-terminal domain